MVTRLLTPFTRYNDGKGNVLKGSLGFTDSNTENDVLTFTDPSDDFNGRIPLPLKEGFVEPWLRSSTPYRVQLKDSDGNQVAYADPYTAGVGQSGDDFSATTTYNKNDKIKASDGKLYISLADGNVGNTPTPSAFWSEYKLPRLWNLLEIYGLEAIVQYQNILYTSLTVDNLNIEPGTTDDWLRVGGTNVRHGLLTTTTADSNNTISVSGLGFKPTWIRFWSVSGDSANNSAGYQMGFPHNDRVAGAQLSFDDAIRVTVINDGSVVDSCWTFTTVNGFATQSSATFTSFDTDGFTIDMGVVSGTGIVNTNWTATDATLPDSAIVYT